MICCSLTPKTAKEAIRNMEKTSKLADIIELRIDYIKDIGAKALKKILESKIKPIIVTNRKKSEKGNFKGNEKHRIKLLGEAIELNADYVDIEYGTDKKLIKKLIDKKNKTKIIISYHNFKKTPNNLSDIYNKIKKLNPDVIKIVTFANSINDNFRIFELLKNKKENEKIIAFCMGEYGQISRILSLKYGSFLTYCAFERKKQSAQGQLTINELLDYYNTKKINKNTGVIGLIGNPVEHSKGYIIHNTRFKKLRLNNNYVKFRVNNLKKFMKNFRKWDFKGASVTMPYKMEIIKYLDDGSNTAKKIGAVNTIVNKNGKLIGHNTDCYGAVKAIKNKTKIKNKKITVFGAGGAARAIIYGLKKEKGKITILNRTVSKAKKLAEEFNCNYGNLNNFKNIDTDILVNATSVGMRPKINQTLIPKKFLKNMVVFDVVFNPPKTRLIKDAESNNCKVISGIEMLLYQAAKQFELWTNKKISVSVIKNLIINK